MPGLIALFLLACNLTTLNSQSVAGRDITRTPLPTLTPTPDFNAGLPAQTPLPGEAGPTPMELPINPPVIEAQPTLVLDSPAAAEPTQFPADTPANLIDAAEPQTNPAGVAGWSFAHVYSYPDPYGGGLLVYGDIVNNTGSVQELVAITGTFFDAQGQVIAGRDEIANFWPFDIVPVGGQLPFALTVFDIQQAANFDLIVDSLPSTQTPHQNFNFANVEEWAEEVASSEGVYCLIGELENQGDYLQEYVLIVAALFDDKNQMLNFGQYYEPEPEDGLTGSPLEFDMCVEVGEHTIARYELRAWGQ